MRRLLWLAILAGGCRYGDSFHCETSVQCVGGGGEKGACVAGSCAFSDEACASGWRYDESAQDDVAGGCLGGNAPADCAAWTPHHFVPCSLPAPLGDLKLTTSGYVYDTDRGELIGGPDIPNTSIAVPQADGTTVRVLSVQSFSVSANIRLRVTGSLPLVIASWTTITVAGHIDATSTAADLIGPGADFAGCTSAGKQGTAGAASKGSGGGGGGGFGGAGGTGGDADVDNAPGRPGGAGGAAVSSVAAVVRGGCRGGASGALGPAASNPNATSAGGEGGGAVLLAARTSIAVSGIVDAGGAGGAPGLLDEGGGGGGGSGGFVGLDAPMITVTGVLAANGGGGGGGGGGTSAGGLGGDGRPAGSAASGGSNGDGASNGGAGSAGTGLTGGSVGANAGLSPTTGAGGGGGGAGVISIHGTLTMTGATISPPVTIDP